MITIYAMQKLRDPDAQDTKSSPADKGKARAASQDDDLDSSDSSENEAVSATLRPSTSVSSAATQAVPYARKSNLGKAPNAAKPAAFIKPQGFDDVLPSKKRDRPQEAQETQDGDSSQEEMIEAARAKTRAKKQSEGGPAHSRTEGKEEAKTTVTEAHANGTRKKKKRAKDSPLKME
jgi:hypothetical protein